MADEKNVNVILSNPKEESGSEIILSFSTIWKKIKKFFIFWFLLAIFLCAGLVLFNLLFSKASSVNSLSSLVSFNYDGIQKGLDPNGNTFDCYEIVTPQVVETSLTETGMDVKLVEAIRSNVTIKGVIPKDAAERITAYQSVVNMENTNALNAAEKMLEVSYNPTQYYVIFNYGNAGMSLEDGETILNKIIDCYRDYFFHKYGYNAVLGNSISSMDYTGYDYSEAIELFDNSLSELQSYVNSLKSNDTNRFRSSVTGYTFSDLTTNITSLRELDLDMISSYINVYNITKDKDKLITYYSYKIESLERSKSIAKKKLEAIQDSLDNYEKDSIMVVAGSDSATTVGQNSEEYDNLIKSKIETQTNVEEYAQKIKYYEDRTSKLKRSQNSSKEQIERVEADLKNLDTKVKDLIETVNLTATDYYDNVTFANAYKVLVPANGSVINETASALKLAIKPILIVEVLLFMIYFIAVVGTALSEDNKKRSEEKKTEKEAEKA